MGSIFSVDSVNWALQGRARQYRSDSFLTPGPLSAPVPQAGVCSSDISHSLQCPGLLPGLSQRWGHREQWHQGGVTLAVRTHRHQTC